MDTLGLGVWVYVQADVSERTEREAHVHAPGDADDG